MLKVGDTKMWLQSVFPDTKEQEAREALSLRSALFSEVTIHENQNKVCWRRM